SCAHAGSVAFGGNLGCLAQVLQVVLVLVQAHFVHDLAGVVQLGGRVVALAFHGAHTVQPAGDALVKVHVVAQVHVHSLHVAQKLGDLFVDLFQRESLVGTICFDGAL